MKLIIKQLRKQFFFLCALSFLLASCELIFIYLFSNLITLLMSGVGISNLVISIIQNVIPFEVQEQLEVLVVTLIFVSTILFMAKTYYNWFTSRLTEKIRFRLASRMMNVFQFKTLTDIESVHSSDVIKKLTVELDSYTNEFIRLAVRVILGLSTISLIITYLFFLDFLTTIVSIIFITFLYVLTSFISSSKMRDLGRQRSIVNQERIKILSEFLLNFRYFLVTRKIKLLQNKYENTMKASSKVQARRIFISQTIPISVEYMIFIGFFSILILMPDTISDETKLYIVSFFVGIFRMNPYLKEGAMLFNSYSFNKNILKDINDFCNIDNSGAIAPIDDFKDDFKEINLRDVSYMINQTELISNFNWTFNRGKVSAIVGASGSGKSTLVDLTLGLKTPTSGSILLDNAMPASQLLAQGLIGYVPQQPLLSNGTILENIVGFDEAVADMRKVRKVIAIAQLEEVISKVHGGLSSIVNERGTNLSGGQMQRVAIARALYNETCKIIVLDEATSALDKETAMLVIEAIKDKVKDKVIIIVTHDPAVAATCDEVIRLTHDR